MSSSSPLEDQMANDSTFLLLTLIYIWDMIISVVISHEINTVRIHRLHELTHFVNVLPTSSDGSGTSNKPVEGGFVLLVLMD